MALENAIEVLRSATRQLAKDRERAERIKHAAYVRDVNNARAEYFSDADGYGLHVMERINSTQSTNTQYLVALPCFLIGDDTDSHLVIGDIATENEYARAVCENTGLMPEEFTVGIIEDELGRVCLVTTFTPPLQPSAVSPVQG